MHGLFLLMTAVMQSTSLAQKDIAKGNSSSAVSEKILKVGVGLARLPHICNSGQAIDGDLVFLDLDFRRYHLCEKKNQATTSG